MGRGILLQFEILQKDHLWNSYLKWPGLFLNINLYYLGFVKSLVKLYLEILKCKYGQNNLTLIDGSEPDILALLQNCCEKMRGTDISYFILFLSRLLIYIFRSRCCRYDKQSACSLKEICMNYEASEPSQKSVSPVNSKNIQTESLAFELTRHRRWVIDR